MKKIIVLITLLFHHFLLFSVYAENIDIRSKQLLGIKRTIKEKEQQKKRLFFQERIFKKDLKLLNDDVVQTEKKLKQRSLNIKTIQHSLENSSRIYNSAFIRSSGFNKIILDEMRCFNKMTFVFRYEQNPLEYKIRKKSLEYEKENFEKAKKEVTVSALNIKRFEKSKKNLLSLQQRENKLVEQHKNMLKEKNVLLNITSDKKHAIEREIKSLNDSAKALQALINRINVNKQNKKTTVITRSTAFAKIKRKKTLPWPVNGKIILNFGRNKHPDLDTYVISNGIKISADDFSQVKSIDAGTVVFTGRFRSYGKVIVINHKNSTFSVYGLLEHIFVKEDQLVSKNTVIANLGSGENNVLYFEIRQNNFPDNPVLWLQQK
ncbi:MAG: peptidoglycan DD-metalloendopeptidase family protein [Endomicrobium sp.]|nr:peptidoglycan DD-metalloendopeptidase family protein [Endomicrobium sp.]